MPWLAKNPEVTASIAVTTPFAFPCTNRSWRSADTIPSSDRSAKTSQRSRPKTRIGTASSSASGYCCSVRSLTSVDLPAPLGPSTAVCSPAGMVRVSRSSTRAPPRTTVASRSSTSGAVATLAGCNRSRAELAIEVEDRRRVVLDQPELGDDLARGFLFLHLLGEEPLQLGHLRERLLCEAQLVERVDLRRDTLLVRQRLLEHCIERVEGDFRLLDGVELDLAVARQDEVEQLQPVHSLFVALHAQPLRGAEKLLLLTEPGHRKIAVRRLELRIDLLVDRLQNSRIHASDPPSRRSAEAFARRGFLPSAASPI